MADGQLAPRIVAFVRTLRAAGLPLGTGRGLDAVAAAAAAGAARREDFYWALHAVLVSGPEQHALFDEAFRLFWREPSRLPDALSLLLPRAQAPPPPRAGPSRRLAEALGSQRPTAAVGSWRVEEAERLAWSPDEALRSKDFAAMSVEEIREAERAIARLEIPAPDLRSRRLRPDPRGDRVDLRATLRATMRAGHDVIPLRWRSTVVRPPVLVALLDVSGSMARYSRMLLRFLHALTRKRERVHTFTFGTRVTPLTRHLRYRDPDAALAAAGRAVRDWEGGTRIGACLREFNLRWSRRLLAPGAVVILVSDGLDRDDGRGLAQEADRLRRSCRRLIWLNPLLRYEGFEPLAAGIRAMLPHVDAFLPVHDLESLEQVARALSAAADRRPAARGRAGLPRTP